MIFWDIVKVLLKQKGINLTQCADMLNINLKTFQDWVYSKRLPDLETGCKLAKIVEVPLEKLIEGDIELSDEEELILYYRQASVNVKPLILASVKSISEQSKS